MSYYDTTLFEEEIDCTVYFDFYSGCNAKMHLPNGDPGYPAEDPEVEITKIIRDDTEEEIELKDEEYDRLSDEILEAIYSDSVSVHL